MVDEPTPDEHTHAEPDPEVTGSIKCLICDQAIAPEEFEGDDPTAGYAGEFDSKELDLKQSTTRGFHLACMDDAPKVDMSDYLAGVPFAGAAGFGEPWEHEWHDVLQYAYRVRERLRAGAQTPAEQPHPLSATFTMALPGQPAPVRPLHIGHPTVEAWLHLFEIEVVAGIKDILAPTPVPTDDEMLFGYSADAALPMPGEDLMPEADGPSDTERCESLLAVTEDEVV